MRQDRRSSIVAALLVGLALVAGCTTMRSAAAPIGLGAVFPISGNAAGLAGPELAGVRIAVDLVNADGGIAGRRVELEVRDLQARADADAIMVGLRDEGIRVVIGAYSSDLSIAASAAADRAGLLYWEAGAVADQLTGRGLPMVFRVGASGANLGRNSARFAAHELASRLGRTVGDLRIAIASANDAYAESVADAAAAQAAADGAPIVARVSYDLGIPDWPTVMTTLAAARPDTIILASHIPDGIEFREEMLAAGLRVGALIGSTMAECDPDFAADLGPDAVGIFASDRPTAGFRPEALGTEARAAYGRFATAWAKVAATAGGAPEATEDPEYVIDGPAESPSAEASEEALAGFSATWALLRNVLPAALGGGSNAAALLDPTAIAAVARGLDLPEGSLPNGAGLRFSSDGATLGQNERASAVIWQWQAVKQYAFVWPPAYKTGEIGFVPLER